MKFLLHKDKIEKGKTSPQKQECGCPSLQLPLWRDRLSLRSHTQLVPDFFPGCFFSRPACVVCKEFSILTENLIMI